ncbi:hypothetical protein CDL15_Pgr023435 [Punica granatum]|uniref:Uncharacterized protein n=1 Tax=Punica granatum TaxID=22663 RepID=A0A218XV37_PUNGR|nr:hypothetical protein CDL15_Pgr023435 [Punica granatum]PKI44106.1 hypothetical protein CRG98_035498 [Punica granatum]
MQGYDTFAHYCSNRAALREPESLVDEVLARTSPPHAQKVEAETTHATSKSQVMEVPRDVTAEASTEAKTAYEALQAEAKTTLE